VVPEAVLESPLVGSVQLVGAVTLIAVAPVTEARHPNNSTEQSDTFAVAAGGVTDVPAVALIVGAAVASIDSVSPLPGWIAIVAHAALPPVVEENVGLPSPVA